MPPSPLSEDTPLPPPTEREAAALAWFSRCRQGLSAEQETEFQNWLTADPRHAALFNEFDGTWELLGRVSQATPMAIPTVPRSFRWAPLVRLGLSVAAAAALVVTYFSWWRPSHYSGAASTAVGALRSLQLPDGSLVMLNTDSALTAAFTPEERRITLERGEAHFAVARNPDRPFIVEVGGIAVRAVGTAFKVHLEAEVVEVLVTEGKVRVDDAITGRSLLTSPAGSNHESLPALGQPVLATGQKVVLALPAAVDTPASRRGEVAAIPVSREEIQRELAWQERRLDFELATLREIAAEFNRYNHHKLVIGDPDLAQKRFGGSFRPDDLAGFVRMLQQNFGVAVDETERATVLRSRH
jgi:transmembrane sensor